MLPAGARLRRSADFTATLRRARAARGDGLLTLHLAIDRPGSPSTDPTPTASVTGPRPTGPRGARVGFVVPRSVGPAVTRNRVRRRLRHLVRDRLDAFPSGARMVVRVLPPAAAASSAALGVALDRAVAKALDRASTEPRPASTGADPSPPRIRR